MIFHPLALPGVEDHEPGTQCPGHRVEDEHPFDAGEEGQHPLDPHDAEQAQRHQQYHHGRYAGTGAAHRTGQPVQDAEQEIEGAEPVHGGFAEEHHGLVVGEQVHDSVLPEQQQGTGGQRVHKAHGQGDPGAFFDPVQLARAVVLAHKGGGG